MTIKKGATQAVSSMIHPINPSSIVSFFSQSWGERVERNEAVIGEDSTR